MIANHLPLASHPVSVATIRRVLKGTGSASVATWDLAKANLIQMFECLLKEALIAPEEISHVVLTLAGAGRAEDAARVKKSLTDTGPFSLCKRLTVTSDIHPLLMEARRADPSLASIVAIAGTGTLVASLDNQGSVVRAGGWGPNLGDEGSGWGLTLSFLKTFLPWIDNNYDPENIPEGLEVLKRFVAEKQLPVDPSKLNSAIIALASDRHLAAQLAPSILELATQPAMPSTRQLVTQQIELLSAQIQLVHRRLSIGSGPWRLCLAGGLASNDIRFQNFLLDELKRRGIEPVAVTVLDPITAALNFAADA